MGFEYSIRINQAKLLFSVIFAFGATQILDGLSRILERLDSVDLLSVRVEPAHFRVEQLQFHLGLIASYRTVYLSTTLVCQSVVLV